MSTITVLTCDRCGANVPQNGDHQFWEVGVITACRPQIAAHKAMYQVDKKHKMEVCRPCIEDMGLVPSRREDKTSIPTPPTLEELIREIVAEEVGAAIDG